MPDRKKCLFSVDGDTVEVEFVYDPKLKRWYGEYPVFEEMPRHTPSGRPWKNVFQSDCAYGDSQLGDCGGCSYFRRENPGDVVAVCFCDEMKQKE